MKYCSYISQRSVRQLPICQIPEQEITNDRS